MTARQLQTRLNTLASPADAIFLQKFFKTGPGEYGEGDRFMGIRVPVLRALAKEASGTTTLEEVQKLIRSPWHETRLLGLLILTYRVRTAGEEERQAIFDFCLAHTAHINNWDLVDQSSPDLIGSWLYDRDRRILRRLAKSKNLWERRIAIVSTHWFIRNGQFDDTLAIAALLLDDRHDLIHKAVGWMLREVGKRDQAVLEGFLQQHCRVMPRTMLRYAIERFPEKRRKAYLAGTP